MDISISGNQDVDYQYIRISVRRTPYGGKNKPDVLIA